MVLELAGLLAEHGDAGDVAGKHVRGALDASEAAAQAAGHRLGQHGLAHAGYILEQHMPLAEEGRQQALDRRVLAQDHTLHVVAEAARQNRYIHGALGSLSRGRVA